MTRPVSDVAFSSAVKAVQERLGSRHGYARMEESGGWQSEISPDLARFIAERDSFYLGTASADGQPYVQYRGGPKGFLKVIDDHTLAFADFGGNRQFISMGNLTENPRVSLFLIDYPNQRRIKIWGRAEVVEDDSALLRQLVDHDYEAIPERVFRISVEAWDVNCRRHIVRRFTEEEIGPLLGDLRDRIATLEAELERLRPATLA